MKILFVNQHVYDTVGGSETQCHAIASELVRIGHEVMYAICLPKHRDYQVPYKTFLIGERFSASFKAALEGFCPDVIYWRYNKKKLLSGALIAKLKRTHIVFAVSHINDVKPLAIKPFNRRHVGWLRYFGKPFTQMQTLLSGAINYAALGFMDALVLQHAGQVPRHFGVPYKVIRNSCVSAGESVIRNDLPYVIWISNIKKAKNPEIFIRLAQVFVDVGVEFVMAGSIQDPSYNWMLDSKGELPSNLRYLGFLKSDMVNAWLKKCLFVVHTCDPEGFPNIFIQAWMQRKPVVSLYFDPDNLLAENQLGFLSGNFAALKQHTADLIYDTELREQMGDAAYRFASEHFDLTKNVKALESFLLHIANTKKGRGA